MWVEEGREVLGLPKDGWDEVWGVQVDGIVTVSVVTMIFMKFVKNEIKTLGFKSRVGRALGVQFPEINTVK